MMLLIRTRLVEYSRVCCATKGAVASLTVIGNMAKRNSSREDLLDIKEAADFLSVSTKTIRRYLKSGKLKGRKVKNAWHVPKKQLENLAGVDEKQVQQAEPPGPAAGAHTVTVPAGVEAALSDIRHWMSEVDRKLYAMCGEGVSPVPAEELDKRDGEIEQLRAENRRLEEELEMTRKQADENRHNGTKENQLLKSKTEENERLKATIASNQRGLALLRDEVARYREEIRNRDTVIGELKNRLVELERKASSDKKSAGVLFGRKIL